MRVYSLSKEDEDFLGIEDGGALLDLTRGIALYEASKDTFFGELYRDIEELIWDNLFTMHYLGEVMEFTGKHDLAGDLTVKGEYEVNPPVYPGKIIALGNNYHNHIKEMNNKVPEAPVLFGKWPSTVIGHNSPIRKPKWIGDMSYEAELAFVIGQVAKNVPRSEAIKYVAGYTCLNDVTAREIQRKDLSRSLPWMPSKNFDTFAPMGPCILLAGAVSEPVEIGVQSRVNGVLKQDGNTRDLIFDIPTVIEYITKIMTLEPGDVVSTGTPEGVGFIEPGDVVEITCTGIGALSNPVSEP
jgi:2-keto-4-pentenoate hydratase/2-oxohepta-3-ene-1,7-dioic acid hydratase in catechol pathway